MKRAADLEDSSGCYAVGVCFFHGQGTEKNREKATFYLKKAAEKGQTQAIELIQNMWRTQKDIEIHQERAEKPLKKSAVY